MNTRRLMDDWPDSFCADDGPDEKGDASTRNEEGLDREQVANLVNREPDGWKGAKPEEDEAHKVDGSDVGIAQSWTSRNDIFPPVVPDGANHQIHALASNPSLHAVPDASHGSTVEDWPESTPDAKGRPTDDGEGNMVHGTNATGNADEASGDEIADPDAEPCLPPTSSSDDWRGGDHPGVDVE